MAKVVSQSSGRGTAWSTAVKLFDAGGVRRQNAEDRIIEIISAVRRAINDGQSIVHCNSGLTALRNQAESWWQELQAALTGVIHQVTGHKTFVLVFGRDRSLVFTPTKSTVA